MASRLWFASHSTFAHTPEAYISCCSAAGRYPLIALRLRLRGSRSKTKVGRATPALAYSYRVVA